MAEVHLKSGEYGKIPKHLLTAPMPDAHVAMFHEATIYGNMRAQGVHASSEHVMSGGT